ncbi:Proline iminopeptidase [Paramyrothecium foliicola]|nr:Proline iminopeptidase [Paramyrothecium foliicola]
MGRHGAYSAKFMLKEYSRIAQFKIPTITPSISTMMVDFIDINGARLAYRLTGPDQAPLMITLHGGRGFGDHKSDFKVYSQLNDQIRVLSSDYRGHGQSSHTKPYTFEQLVDDIEGVRKNFIGDEQAIICGGSFGGFLAQHYAIKYAAHVSHLILRGTAASHHHEAGAIKILEERISRVPSFSVDMLRNKVFGAYESNKEFELVYFAMLPLYDENLNPDIGLKRALETVFNAESHNDLYSEEEKYFDYVDRLPEIKADTLVVVGDKDWICPLENSELISERIPHAEIFVVKDANHGVHAERPDLVLPKIRKHLQIN